MILTLNIRPTGRIHKKEFRIFSLFLIFVLMSLVSYIVYITGGTKTPMPHLMYIPIILAALFFGILGAVGAAFIGALALGPFMPENVSLGIMQEPASWIFRWGFFTLIGILIAILFKWILDYTKKEREQSTINLITGLPNANKLDIDLSTLMDAASGFSLLGFKIVNMDDINRYASYEIGVKSLFAAVETLRSLIGGTVYSIYVNEFAIVTQDIGIEETRKIGLQFLDKTKAPFLLDGFHIALAIKGGLVHFPLQADSPKDMIKKLGIALDHKAEPSGLQVYDDTVARERKERFDLAVALLDAIKNHEFRLVYQPKISLSGRSVIGVEALLRWDHEAQAQVGPDTFIGMAEEMGIISEISKWVIRCSVEQAAAWEKSGSPLGIAINLSPNDLKNPSVIHYLIQLIEENTLDPSLIEVELTERALFENEKMVLHLLGMHRDLGVKISLDDLGTGYSSLIDLVLLPIDHIKIDKSFIDNVLCENYQILIKTIVDYAHNSNTKIIAEGVETEAQLSVLEKMGCDCVQGYYFSKPLPVDRLEAYISRPPAGR